MTINRLMGSGGRSRYRSERCPAENRMNTQCWWEQQPGLLRLGLLWFIIKGTVRPVRTPVNVTAQGQAL